MLKKLQESLVVSLTIVCFCNSSRSRWLRVVPWTIPGIHPAPPAPGQLETEIHRIFRAAHSAGKKESGTTVNG